MARSSVPSAPPTKIAAISRRSAFGSASRGRGLVAAGTAPGPDSGGMANPAGDSRREGLI
jgi:hypothetical protein